MSELPRNVHENYLAVNRRVALAVEEAHQLSADDIDLLDAWDWVLKIGSKFSSKIKASLERKQLIDEAIMQEFCLLVQENPELVRYFDILDVHELLRFILNE